MTSREESPSKFRALITRRVNLPSWVLYTFLASWATVIVIEYGFGRAIVMLIGMVVISVIFSTVLTKLRQRRGTTSNATWTGNNVPMWYAAIAVVLTIVYVFNAIRLLLF